ncbi:MAG: type II secretion system protein GspG, partial [Candidatus Hydrogenedentes bacterium]|nr:type II secretion system protein GspG [Candidatus Hydrogenedentota bacterium]
MVNLNRDKCFICTGGRPVNNRRKIRRASAGFTLIELMVVIVIIGILAMLVGPKLMGATDDAKVMAAVAQIRNFKTALDMYKLKFGNYPKTAEGLEALI